MTTEIKVKLKNFRTAPRKVRLVADLIRRKKAARARDMLSMLNKKAAKPMLKLLNSAIANAKHNHNLSLDGLVISKVTVDDGPTLKRWMPRARGRATTIRKRSCHVNLVLVSIANNADTDKDDANKDKKEEKNKKESKEKVVEKKVEKKVEKNVNKKEEKSEKNKKVNK